MNKNRRTPLARTLTHLAVDSPYVIATRVGRMLNPAVALSAAGQAEFLRMFSEKQAAAVESCSALLVAGAAQYQAAWLGLWSGALPGSAVASQADLDKALNSTLKPFQRRASANARRLRSGR